LCRLSKKNAEYAELENTVADLKVQLDAAEGEVEELTYQLGESNAAIR
jgi:hypothetical protein